MYPKDRGSRGGGVFLAVKQSIPSTLIPSSPSVEVVSIRISLKSLSLSVSVVYIPPKVSVAFATSTPKHLYY